MLNLDPFPVPLSLNIANKGREIGRRKREIQRERENKHLYLIHAQQI